MEQRDRFRAGLFSLYNATKSGRYDIECSAILRIDLYTRYVYNRSIR